MKENSTISFMGKANVKKTYTSAPLSKVPVEIGHNHKILTKDILYYFQWEDLQKTS